MKAKKIYLDNCCYNRPYDAQDQIKVRLETEAKLEVQRRIKAGAYILIWSYILEFENFQNPFQIRREEILKWKALARITIAPADDIAEKAESIAGSGLRPKDALHIACAIAAKADCLLTTDNVLLKKKALFSDLQLMNPTEFVATEEEDHEK